MENQFPREDEPRETGGQTKARQRMPGLFSRWTGALLGMGLGESLLRLSTNVLSILALVAVIWLAQTYYRQRAAGDPGATAAEQMPTEAVVQPAPAQAISDPSSDGISRLAQIHTTIPSRPRQDIVKYTVVQGDTIFGIAEKYGIKPQTVLWGNYGTLLDDPHNLQPGQTLNILPIDGTYYEWQAGDGLNGVAKFFGVSPEVIINYPANELNPDTIGDLAAPNIPPGKNLIVPGGERAFTSWSAPLGVTRENPSTARVLGPGFCDPVVGGAVGYGVFVWPANDHFLSGFDYRPDANHWGIDLAGSLGEGVYAADAGVVVYAGWNNYGYGNMIMIDHGNGFQTLYAHLSDLYRFCGQSVGQGEGIGAIGSTGNSSGAHLHFEIRTETYFVNPWDYLPAP